MQLESIAIIGIGCRFPGAKNPQAFWSLIRDGIDGVSEVPQSRWDINSYYDRDPSKPGKTNTRWGGFLEQIDYFDPQFFGIAPKEAITMDPQQRLLLEVAWETLEDAGQIPEDLRGSKTGVFIGIGTHDYSIMMWQQPVSEPYATTGTGNCIAANRISYIFDFKGPSLAVDTACSSSLVAVHLACQSIWTGESAIALAGGVNMLLLPTIMVGFSKGGFMSSDGRCKSFDASADGYVRGEGAGLILLKPLSQAQADGDDIYGVILSSAVNQDGTSQGMAAPNPLSQEAVLREAYERGGIDPAQVGYIEAHGTGTKVGDPIEMNALGAVVGEHRQEGNNCLVGSVKTNIGHTETAAGIAGIIKVALALKHRQIPPSLHFNQPNSAIAFDKLKLKVVTELTTWENEQSLIAGVNSFGFGGTNAHIVMRSSETKGISEAGSREQGARERRKSESESLSLPVQLLTISAKSKSALQDLAQNYQDFIQQTDFQLPDICIASQRKRSHFNHRLTCISNSTQQLTKQLTAFISGKEIAGVTTNCIGNKLPKICWLFTGQGSQYIGMGQQLYNSQPVFRETLNRCADILQSYLDIPLLEIIFHVTHGRDVACYVSTDKNDQSSIINQTIYTQPAIFAFEYALAQLWLSWGIKPNYVMGHSIGEYVAACVAGVFSLEDALKLVANRGRLMQELPSSGGMLAIFNSQEKVKELIATYDQEVNIAAINNDQNTVISGKTAVLNKIKEKLDNIGIKSSLLKVSHAFHSPLMQPMLARFREVAESITYSLPEIPLVSNVTAKLADGEITNADYWVDHIIQPVRFAHSFQFLLEQEINIFLEIGAKPILSSLGTTILARVNSENPVLLIPSLSDKKTNEQVILNSIAKLYHQGIKIDWQEFSGDYQLQEIKLPTYPFQRQKYWWDNAKFWTENNLSDEQKLDPFLGNILASTETSEIRFQGQINSHNPEYLQDHCLEEQVVFPATGYLSIALAAGQQILQTNNLRLENFTIKQPLLLSEKSITLQTVVTESDNCVQIFSKTEQNNNFILHSDVAVKVNQKQTFNYVDIKEIKSKLYLVEEIDNFYDKLSKQGLNYGANFQGIRQLWQGENRALGYIQISDNINDNKYQLHPALLDSCFQLISAATESQQGVYLPVGIDSLELYRSCNNSVWAEIKIKPSDNPQILNADIKLVDSQGSAIAFIQNLSLQYLSLPSLRKLINLPDKTESIQNCLYEIDWQPQKLDHESTNELPSNWLIFSEDKDLAIELEKKLPGKSILVFPGAEFKEIVASQYTINSTKPEEFQQLWQEIKSEDSQSWGIIYLNVGVNDVGANSRSPLQQGCAAILHLMQSLKNQISQLMIVTQETQFKNTQNLSGAIWGLARTINLEYPNLNCVCLDLEATEVENNVSLILSELQYGDRETQIAYHNNQRYVPRLTPQNNILNNSFRLQLSNFGTLDNLTLAPLQRRSPQAGEIEIAVQASGVNFRDVLNALGVLKEYLQKMGFADATKVPFGGECAGIIVAVGAGVTDFQIGDQVIAAQAVGSLSSHVTIDAKFAIAKPESLTYAEAATIPTTFLTAYYGLHYLAKIKPGDKILIHAAAGGVGQAAVQLAQQAGAEVFATASLGKWDFLKASGIKHVMNSRTLDFAEEVMQLTKGKGVDLILNSLNGDFILKNLEVLAPQGRFVEIGKVGIWDEIQVAEAREDVSYFPFDLLEVSQKNPDLITTLFTELREQFVTRKLEPLPHKVFPIQEADQAFRYMAQAKHIGKVVISLPTQNSQIVREDGCYLITGGLGSLGLQVANWLVNEGAKHLILIGRSQPSNNARETIVDLEELGAKIQLEFADICDYFQLEQIINQVQLPLRGVIHAAGILDDGLLTSLSWERFQTVLNPKMMGTWNLHLVTEKLDLDWFVGFSSVVSVFGAAGQGNYAAANAFLDNLMSYRRNLGLPGLAINWSIWDDGGMASRLSAQQQQRLSQQGLSAIAPKQGLKILKQLLQQQTAQSIVFPVDWSAFLAQQPDNLFFEKLKPQTTNKNPQITSFIQQLAETPQSDRHQVLQEHIREQMAKVLGFSDPEDIDVQEKFADLGMDSLMAVEFKNSLQASFGDAVSLTATFDYPNIELLTDYIAQELFDSDEFCGDTESHGRDTACCVSTDENIEEKPAIFSITRNKIEIKPEFCQFKLTPEFINLKKDLERVEKLGNPFFSLHGGIAKDTIQTGDRELINYSSYNYLGMSGDRVITEAAQNAIAEYGTSVSASRLLSGERPLHLELERAIADFIGTEDAIAYVGGHATNVSTIGHLFGERDLIICDSLSHNSIKEGCKLSGATIIDFPHNNCQALKEILERERTKYEKVLIAIEGIYSTDGDLAPLPNIVELKQHYQTFLLVDEAHSIGVLGLSGGGIREHFNLQATDVDLWMGTLSKSFASCGGYIAGDRELIQYLKYTAPGFVFSVGMSPANTAAALAAIQLLKSEPERAIKLQSRAKFCLDLAKSKNFNTGYSADSPIIPIIVGEPNKAVRLSQLLGKEGINVNPMVYPSVPYDAARLRFFVTFLHTEEQILSTMNILGQAIALL